MYARLAVCMWASVSVRRAALCAALVSSWGGTVRNTRVLHVACRLANTARLRATGGDADFGDHATARAVEAALSATVHALPPALEPPRHGGELWELLRRRWCELTAPWRELIAAGTSWRELLQDLELRLDLDLGSEDDFEDREYVRGLFEAEYAEAMSYEGHD